MDIKTMSRQLDELKEIEDLLVKVGQGNCEPTVFREALRRAEIDTSTHPVAAQRLEVLRADFL